MKPRHSIGNLCVCGVLVGSLAISAHAQGQYPARRDAAARPGMAAAPATGSIVQIRRLVGTGRQTAVRTPEYRTSMSKSPTRPRDWAQIALSYDTFPDWIDVLTVQYTVLSVVKEDGENQYSLYRQSVDYLDVERSRDHTSTVFLTPAAVKRYGPPVAVHVEVFMNGALLASEDDIDGGVDLPPRWWENRQVLDSPKLTVRDNYLLKRNQTPFALVNIDDYEVIR